MHTQLQGHTHARTHARTHTHTRTQAWHDRTHSHSHWYYQSKQHILQLSQWRQVAQLQIKDTPSTIRLLSQSHTTIGLGHHPSPLGQICANGWANTIAGNMPCWDMRSNTLFKSCCVDSPSVPKRNLRLPTLTTLTLLPWTNEWDTAYKEWHDCGQGSVSLAGTKKGEAGYAQKPMKILQEGDIHTTYVRTYMTKLSFTLNSTSALPLIHMYTCSL